MRIISKTRDYYDTALGYGIDPNVVYTRAPENFNAAGGYRKGIDVVRVFINTFMENTDIKRLFKRIPQVRGWNNDDALYHGGFIVLFCGKLYPVLMINEPIKVQSEHSGRMVDGTRIVHCYDAETVHALIEKHSTKKYLADYDGTESFKYSFMRPHLHRNIVDALFADTQHNEKALLELHIVKKIPVFKIVDGQFSDMHEVTENPVLKDIQFYKKFNAFMAFQELSMFISGVLGGNSPVMVEVSNETKIHKAGFNKQSFRTRKKEK